MKSLGIFLVILLSSFAQRLAAHNPDDIVGIWMNSQNTLKVQVYKVGDEYRGKIIWFEDAHYKAKMNDCKDELNPDPALRNRKILGLDALTNLKYNADEDNWDNGDIYDSNTGHTYDSVVNMNTTSTITVTGYWMFTWLGRDMTFYKVKE